MCKYEIYGGERLSGQVAIGGAKNSVLPILAASLMTKSTVLHNVPLLSDVGYTIEILQGLGLKVSQTENTLAIENTGIATTVLPAELCKKMRSSILFLGAMLGYCGEATIPYPGGCALGSRPIDIHLRAMEKMGVEINEESDSIYCKVQNLKGTTIDLPFPSVGATENLILLATLSRGVTVINNSAREPEIKDLQTFLNKAGAKICGAGTSTIIVEGVRNLQSTEHSIMPDRIEAGTFLAMASGTGGELFLENIMPNHLGSLIGILKKSGVIVKTSSNSIYIDAPQKLESVGSLSTNIYPKLPTDMQPQLMAMVTKAIGETKITENIFNGRNKHISELVKMGADITERDSQHFIVRGVRELIGCNVVAKDLRGGAGLVIAGLMAEGKTTVDNIYHIERGYEHFPEKIQSIGGRIEKINKDLN